MHRRLVLSSVFVFTAMISIADAANPRPIDNFNDGKVTWSSWASPDAKNPTLSISSDAAEGNGSLLVEFPKSGFTSLACRLGVTSPGNCDAVSFWIKRVSGSPGCDLQLEEDPKACPEGVDCFRAPMPVPASDQWTQVVVPFREFRYAYSLHGKGNQKFEQRKLWAFAVAAYQKPPFAFKIDCVEFIKLTNVATSTATSKNIFTNNTSFELPSHSSDETVDSTTAAVGSCSLKSTGVGESFPTGAMKPNRPYVLSFYAKAPAPGTIGISAWMEYSNIVNTQVPVSTNWTRLSVPVPPCEHPIETRFTIFSTKPGERIWFDGIQLEEGTTPTAYQDADPVAIQAVTGAQSEIVILNEKLPLSLDLAMYNSRYPAANLPFSLYYNVNEATLGQLSNATLSINLEPQKTFAKKITVLPKMQPGYYTVKFSLRDRTGTLIKEIVSPITVVRQPNKIAIDDSFFGMHTDGLGAIGPKPLHAIGVNWIRHGGALWDATEPTKGNFQMPRSIAVIKEGFGPLVTMLTVPPPAWAMGKDGFPASPDLITGYINKVLETYKTDITYYDFHNEPDLTLPQVPGREKSFAALLNAAYPSFKAMGKKLVFDGSGEATGFASEVIKNAPNSFDAFAPHPYANPRYLGPGGMGLGPEFGGMKEQLEKFLAIHRQLCPKTEFWIGELGWALDADAPIDSSWAVRHGAFIARSHLIAKSFPQIKRYINFRDIGCVEGGHYEYGMWRNRDGIKPLPATAAYATVAKLLDGARPLPIISDYDIRIYAYQKDDHVILAAWDSLDDDTVEPLQVEVPTAEAEVWTMTGAAAPRKPGDDKITLMTINANPSYAIIKPGDLDRLAARIHSAVMDRRPASVEISLPNVRTLSSSIKNRLTTPYNASLDVTVGPTRVAENVLVEIPAGGKIPVAINLKTPIELTGQTVKFDLKPLDKGNVVSIQKPLPAMMACRKNTTGLTGFLNTPLPKDPNSLIVLDKREQILPADPTIGWNGPDNLSVKASITWDVNFLYFVADVTDDKHCQPFADVQIWQGDAIQFAIDTLNDAQPTRPYDNNDYEYGFALGPQNQTVTWRWQSPAGVATGKFQSSRARIERVGTHTIYHVAIPWRELLPLKPKLGTVFGLNFIVVDNDGLGRGYWIGMTPGIAEAKLPALFRKFVLVE